MTYIVGGSRSTYQGTPILLQALAWDPDTSLPYNMDPNITVMWSCYNFVNQS